MDEISEKRLVDWDSFVDEVESDVLERKRCGQLYNDGVEIPYDELRTLVEGYRALKAVRIDCEPIPVTPSSPYWDGSRDARKSVLDIINGTTKEGECDG